MKVLRRLIEAVTDWCVGFMVLVGALLYLVLVVLSLLAVSGFFRVRVILLALILAGCGGALVVPAEDAGPVDSSPLEAAAVDTSPPYGPPCTFDTFRMAESRDCGPLPGGWRCVAYGPLPAACAWPVSTFYLVSSCTACPELAP